MNPHCAVEDLLNYVSNAIGVTGVPTARAEYLSVPPDRERATSGQQKRRSDRDR